MAAVPEHPFNGDFPLSQLHLRHRGLIQTPRLLAMNGALSFISYGGQRNCRYGAMRAGLLEEAMMGTWVRAQEVCLCLVSEGDDVDPKSQVSSSALSL